MVLWVDMFICYFAHINKLELIGSWAFLVFEKTSIVFCVWQVQSSTPST